jgi:hypothetical protein
MRRKHADPSGDLLFYLPSRPRDRELGGEFQGQTVSNEEAASVDGLRRDRTKRPVSGALTHAVGFQPFLGA